MYVYVRVCTQHPHAEERLGRSHIHTKEQACTLPLLPPAFGHIDEHGCHTSVLTSTCSGQVAPKAQRQHTTVTTRSEHATAVPGKRACNTYLVIRRGAPTTLKLRMCGAAPGRRPHAALKPSQCRQPRGHLESLAHTAASAHSLLPSCQLVARYLTTCERYVY